MKGRLQQLGNHCYLMVGSRVLLFGMGIGSSQRLARILGLLLLAMTINKLILVRR